MEVLDRPVQFEDRAGPMIWVDEAIWGHRLHDEQSPWLTFLEFLNVLLAEHVAGRAMEEGAFNSLSYRPQTQLKLRNLVFNNPHIMTVLAEDRSDDVAWTVWLEKMAQTAGGLEAPNSATCASGSRPFRTSRPSSTFCRGRPSRATATSAGVRSSSFPSAPTPSSACRLSEKRTVSRASCWTA